MSVAKGVTKVAPSVHMLEQRVHRRSSHTSSLFLLNSHTLKKRPFVGRYFVRGDFFGKSSFKDPPTSNQPSHTPGNAPLSSAHSHTVTKDQLASLPLPFSPQTPWRLPYRPQLSTRVSQRMRLVSQKRRRRRPSSPLPARLERIHSSKWCDRCLRAARSLLNQRGGGVGMCRQSKCPPWLPFRERLFSVVPSTSLATGCRVLVDLISAVPG